MATQLTRAELLRWRLRCQRLTEQPAPGCTAPDVVSRLFALQGQDLPGVLWSLGLRTDGADQDVYGRPSITAIWFARGRSAARCTCWLLMISGGCWV